MKRLTWKTSALRWSAALLAVAISYNGSTQAVMMATPADLVDFAYGFSLTEGIATPEEIDSVTPVETPKGIDLQIWLHPQVEGRLSARRRMMTGPVGCGLCGEVSHAAVLCPSFYRADVRRNVRGWAKAWHRLRRTLIAWMQARRERGRFLAEQAGS